MAMALFESKVEEGALLLLHDQNNNDINDHEVQNNDILHINHHHHHHHHRHDNDLIYQLINHDDINYHYHSNNHINGHAEDNVHNLQHAPLPPPIGHYHSSPELWPKTFRKSMDAYSTFSPKSASFLQWCLNYAKSNSLNKKIKPKHTQYEKTGPHPSPLTTNHDLPVLTNNHLYVHNNQIKEPLLDKGSILVSQPPLLEEGQSPQIGRNYEESIKEVKEEEPKKEVVQESIEKNTFWQTFFHAINVMVGIGLLSCPYALKEGGWLGLLVLVMFAITCCYTAHLLRKCVESEPLNDVTSYPDIAQLAYGKIGRTFISVVLYTELYSYCVEFLILEGDNLSKIFPNFNISYSGIQINSTTSFAIISTLIILPTVCIQNLKWLSVLSLMGVITSCVVLFSFAWLGVVNKVGVGKSSSSFVNWNDLPIAVGVFGFCYSGHGVFPNIYHAMRDKTRYTTILVSSFFLCTLLYGGMAMIGYIMFQDQTLSQITLNVPKGYIASYVVLFLTIISPFTKFALIIAPISNGIEELVPTQNLRSWQRTIVSGGIRVSIVLSCLCVATLVPFFSYIMAFVGSAISMLVVAILPCMCFLKIYKQNATKFEQLLAHMPQSQRYIQVFRNRELVHMPLFVRHIQVRPNEDVLKLLGMRTIINGKRYESWDI